MAPALPEGTGEYGKVRLVDGSSSCREGVTEIRGEIELRWIKPLLITTAPKTSKVSKHLPLFNNSRLVNRLSFPPMLVIE